ncbi:hypothetical protein V5N11_035534 [Cardamine amara subsp. amara]|uniref:NYN domain-containing protein n=1 Tax=Cardamine amara subsp. amara TaxID=228776 RepID=A0ABD1BU62_CARAN
MKKDFRRALGLMDIENVRIPRGFSVSDLMPRLRHLLHSKNYFGPFLLNVVVSDANNRAKIDPIVYRDLYRDREIRVTDCKIPNLKQVADDHIIAKAKAWVERHDSGVLVLIGGDGDYVELLDAIRASGKDFHIFLIYPKGCTAVEIKNFEAEEIHIWEDLFLGPDPFDQGEGDGDQGDGGGDQGDGGGDQGDGGGDQGDGGDRGQGGGGSKRKRGEDDKISGARLLKMAFTNLGEKPKRRAVLCPINSKVLATGISLYNGPYDPEEDMCSETDGSALCDHLTDQELPKWFPDVEVVESPLDLNLAKSKLVQRYQRRIALLSFPFSSPGRIGDPNSTLLSRSASESETIADDFITIKEIETASSSESSSLFISKSNQIDDEISKVEAYDAENEGQILRQTPSLLSVASPSHYVSTTEEYDDESVLEPLFIEYEITRARDPEEDMFSETDGSALCDHLTDQELPKWFPDVEVVESPLEKATSMASENDVETTRGGREEDEHMALGAGSSRGAFVC